MTVNNIKLLNSLGSIDKLKLDFLENFVYTIYRKIEKRPQKNLTKYDLCAIIETKERSAFQWQSVTKY